MFFGTNKKKKRILHYLKTFTTKESMKLSQDIICLNVNDDLCQKLRPWGTKANIVIKM